MTQQTALHREIFDRFKENAIALGHYPSATNADSVYIERLSLWEDLTAYRRFDLSGQNSEYNSAWLLTPASRSEIKRKKFTFLPVLIIGIHTPSGRIVTRHGKVDADTLKTLQAPNILAGVLKNELSYGLWTSTSFADLDKFMAEGNISLVSKLSHHILEGSLKLPTTKEQRRDLSKLAEATAKEVLGRIRNSVKSELEQALDLETLSFAEEFRRNYGPYENFSSIGIYNHLVSASSPQAIDYRKGALIVLAPLHDLFLNDPVFWNDANSGQSIYQALGTKFSVKPATVKRIFQNPGLYRKKDIQLCGPYLDRIDPTYWPTNNVELKYFESVIEAATIYATTFGRHGPDIVVDLVANQPRPKTWKDILERQLDRQIKNVHEERQNYAQQIRYARRKRRRGNLLSTTLVEEPTRSGTKEIKNTDFHKACFAKYRADLNNIIHMKSDLEKRLIRPAIILALEERGYETNAPSIEPLERAIAQELWKTAPPSEQMVASSYWHSERINFAGRFMSIAYTSDLTAEWHPLIEEPLRLKDGTALYPLTSTAMLQEEATAMAHCVWSYSHKCMANSYHIFSLRDRGGERLTTLTVQDFTNSPGQRQIKFIEHTGHANTTPAPIAFAAANFLIDEVNRGALEPNWTEIAAKKAGFLAQQLDKSVGYDFRIDTQRERILALYEPCIPRRILKGKDKTYDTLVASLGIEKHVDAFFESNLNNATIFLRPRMAAGTPPPVIANG